MIVKDKLVVITGVSKGIGKALVELLLANGAFVAGIGRTEPIGISSERFCFFNCDIRRKAEVHEAFGTLKHHFQKPVEVIINNAGLGYFGYLEEMSDEAFIEMYETNVFGIFYCCKEVLADMKLQGGGHIINISSIAGLEGYPQVGAYCSTKFAVRGLSESLYKEVRDFGVKVTCVYPGSVKTDFFRNSPNIKAHDYMLMPEEVAEAIVQLIETSGNYHVVNYEVRPLQPRKGEKK